MRARGFRFWSTATWEYLTLSPHGLFGQTTPSAELAYLTTYGYGVTQRVHVIHSERAAGREVRNDAYVESLSGKRRGEYRQALFGDGATRGCAEPDNDVVMKLGLPDGGELGDAFGQALSDARDTEAYQSWSADVVDCLEDSGNDVPDQELTRMEEPFLRRLLRLAGSKYSVTDEGIKYDLSGDQINRIDPADLRDLNRSEIRVARLEARCRVAAGSGAQDAVDAASAPLVAEHDEDVSLLRTALQRAEQQGE